MMTLLNEIQIESKAALRAHRAETSPPTWNLSDWFTVVICFSNGQRIEISSSKIPGNSEQIILDDQSSAKLRKLEETWKGALKLAAFEFEHISSCGLFGNEQRNDVFTYDLVSRSIKQSTTYIR